MKIVNIFLIIIFTLSIAGCVTINVNSKNNTNPSDNNINSNPIDNKITSTSELTLTTGELNKFNIEINESSCDTQTYETGNFSSQSHYTICFYEMGDTKIVFQLSKYTNFNDLNGSYQYDSLHLRGFNGLIEENKYGNLSRFYVNNESTTYYYHVWIVENPFLIHVTSKGVKEDKDIIENIGKSIISKFE